MRGVCGERSNAHRRSTLQSHGEVKIQWVHFINAVSGHQLLLCTDQFAKDGTRLQPDTLLGLLSMLGNNGRGNPTPPYHGVGNLLILAPMTFDLGAHVVSGCATSSRSPKAAAGTSFQPAVLDKRLAAVADGWRGSPCRGVVAF